MAMGKRNEIEQVGLEDPTFNINNTNSKLMDDGGEMGQNDLEGLRFNINENIPEAPAMNATQLPVDLRSIDDLPDLEVLKEAFVQLCDALPEDHPDFINVRTAMRKVRDHKIALSEQEEADMSGIQPDPREEAEQFFNQQMQIFERPFDGDTLEPEIMPDETLPDETFMEEQTLEQIVQEESTVPAFMEQDMISGETAQDMSTSGAVPHLTAYDIDPAIDEINQAIDQVAGQPMPEELEPDPFQPQYDPFMAPDYMFNSQYMPDYMMPGPMPYGPMGPGPMGPMPGPM
jgi:hypothetical protein